MNQNDTRNKKQRLADANAAATTRKMADQFLKTGLSKRAEFVKLEEMGGQRYLLFRVQINGGES